MSLHLVTPTPGSAAEPAPVVPRTELSDRPAVETLVAHLARAVQRHHAYPASNPLCMEAVTAAVRALEAIPTREQITLRVSLGGLVLDTEPLGGQRGVIADLTRRLRRAGAAAVTISRDASPREISRFCREVAGRSDAAPGLEPLADVLAAYGVERIQVATLHEPEVLDVPAPTDVRLRIIEHEQSRRAQLLQSSGPCGHLYPPDKGWVRVDPTCPLRRVGVADLPLLVEDPIALARLLTQLAEDPGAGTAEETFADRFEEIAGLVASLDPAIVETVFARLARSVLALAPELRQRLLRETVLPGLLEGRVDGYVLRHFPDFDLAESLALMLDLQVAAPELLTVALERLDLEDRRQEAIKPLVEAHVVARAAGLSSSAPRGGPLAPGAIDGYVKGQIQVDHSQAKDFGGFADYDLAIDDATRARFAAMSHDIASTDAIVEQIRCALNVVGIEANPQVATALLEKVAGWLDQVRARPDWATLAAWLGHCGAEADALRDERPEIAEGLDAAVRRVASAEMVTALATLAGHRDRVVASAVLLRCGRTLVPAMIEVLEREPPKPVREGLVYLLCEHARPLAPALVPYLEHPQWFVVRQLVHVIGHAGPGSEAAIGPRLHHDDDRVAREAFRALARVGTPDALALVVDALQSRGGRQALAEDALWRFEGAIAGEAVRTLLDSPEFVRRHPALAGRLLARAAQTNAAPVDHAIDQLARLRFHLWRPGLARLGAQAASLRRRAR